MLLKNIVCLTALLHLAIRGHSFPLYSSCRMILLQMTRKMTAYLKPGNMVTYSPHENRELDHRTPKKHYTKKQCKERLVTLSGAYESLDHIQAISNACERLFSAAGLILTDLRHALLPRTLEMILFLKCNRRLWNQVQVAQAVNVAQAVSDQQEQQEI